MTGQNKKLIIFLVVVLALAALRFSGLGSFLTLENVRQSRDSLASTVRDYPLGSILVYIIAYVLVSGLAIPGAALLTMTGGFVFGTIPGMLYTCIGANLGANLAFLAARYLAGEWVQAKYGDRLAGFNRELGRNASSYLVGVRLVPVIPFFLINVLSGFTRVPLSTFAWTTAVGIVPGTLLFSYAGRQIGTINSPSDVFSGPVIAAFAGLAVLALAPAVIDRLKIKRE